MALETFLEEVKFEPANIPINGPKDNLSPGERRPLHNLLGDKTIIVKKADKGTTTVIMSREQKIKEGQILLNDLYNCRPLEKQMADETAEKIKQLTTSMLTEGHIDEMTVKWLSQTLNPPRIPEFYTLTKIHKPTLVGRPIISGRKERIHKRRGAAPRKNKFVTLDVEQKHAEFQNTPKEQRIPK